MSGADGLVVEGLDAELGGRPVLRGAALTARAGAVTALLGPNGAGKSTLLRAVLGLIASRGRIAVDGVDPRALTARARARLVAYVPQRSRLTAALPAAAVVAQGRYAHAGAFAGPGRADREAVAAALAATDATALAERPFDALSAGEQQRVLIARALATGARVVLLDEPTAALDVGHALALHATLRRLAGAGRALVVVLHQLEEARAHADHAVLLHEGRVLASGTPDAVLAAAPLRQAYGVEPVPATGTAYRLVEGGR